MMPNVNQYYPIVVGIIRAGMVLTTVNPLYTARELKHQLTDSDAEAIFILEPFCATLNKVIHETNVKTLDFSDFKLSLAGGMAATPVTAKDGKKRLDYQLLKAGKCPKV